MTYLPAYIPNTCTPVPPLPPHTGEIPGAFGQSASLTSLVVSDNQYICGASISLPNGALSSTGTGLGSECNFTSSDEIVMHGLADTLAGIPGAPAWQGRTDPCGMKTGATPWAGLQCSGSGDVQGMTLSGRYTHRGSCLRACKLVSFKFQGVGVPPALGFYIVIAT